MPFIEMSDYNWKARVYWWGAALLGAVGLLYSLAGVLRLSSTSMAGLVVLMAVVCLSGMRAISIAGTKTSITSGDLFVFLALLFWGVPAAVLVAVTDAAAASYRTSRRWTSRLGSPAIMAITVLASGTLFKWALEAAELRGLSGTTTFLATLMCFSLVYFFINSALLTVHLALKKRGRMLRLWWENYPWAILPYAASASAAGLIFLAIERSGPGALLAAGPLVAIIFATCHLHFKRADERADAAEASARQALVHMSEMEESEERFRSAFNHAPIGIALIAPDGKLLQVNHALCQVVGYSESELLAMEFQNILHPDDLNLANAEVAQLLAGDGPAIPTEQRYLHKLGHEVWVLVSSSLVRDPRSHAPLLIFQIQDITDRRRAKQLAHYANHDALTGLPNRAFFADRLSVALQQGHRRRDQSFALLFLDFDKFKQINDTLGHLTGDQLLVAIARRLEAATRQGDTVARLGGDEFTILLEDVRSGEEAIALANRIQGELSVPFELEEHVVSMSASIGIALSDDGFSVPQDMLGAADSAMYQAKSRGSAQCALFNQTHFESGRRLYGYPLNATPDGSCPPENDPTVVHKARKGAGQTGALRRAQRSG
jgi:diguanylate cyclase (GGDEF)-like protein/PAS domain S-box-containing protein